MKQMFLYLFLSLFISANSFAADALKFIESYIPESPPGAQVMAGFMTIQNASNQLIEIVSVTSPEFHSVEMHLSKEVDGIAKMLQQEKLSIPANASLVLKPGSYHLMLMKPRTRLLDGASVALVFSLSSGEALSHSVTVKKKNNNRMRQMKCASGKCGGGKCGSNP